jgi:hypothetical protein
LVGRKPAKPRRLGRPKLPQASRAPHRPVLTMRVKAEVYAQTVEAAQRSNRKITEEAGYRLEQSFIWEETHVRFTPETYAILKGVADANGRSFSEEVEYRIEKQLAEAALKSAVRLDARLRALTEEKFRQIIEDAVTRALAGRDKQKDERS